MNLCGRSLISLKDFTPQEIRYFLDVAKKAKDEHHRGIRKQRFLGMTIALLFEKRSTRTRCSFETAFGEEGGHPVFLSSADIQLGVKETVEDTAHVLGRMFDCIEFRGFKTRHVEILSEVSGIPVINGLSDDFHPTQVLADLMTLEEHFGVLKGKKLAFVGDGRNNMANSLMIGCAKMGVDVAIVAPDELHPESDLVKLAEGFAKEAGSTVLITSDVDTGIKGADVIYTDVWASMGEETKLAERIKLLKPYQVNSELMAKTGKESVFMHCLPAVRNNEVTPDVIDGKQSVVWDEAENRKWTIKAVMLCLLGKENE